MTPPLFFKKKKSVEDGSETSSPLDCSLTVARFLSCFADPVIAWTFYCPTSRSHVGQVTPTLLPYGIICSSPSSFSIFFLNLVILRSDLCHELTSKSTNLTTTQLHQAPRLWDTCRKERSCQSVLPQRLSQFMHADTEYFRHKVDQRKIHPLCLLWFQYSSSPVGLLTCTRRGDVVVYVDNFTFPLALWHTSFEWRTGCLLFGLLLLFVTIEIFLSQNFLCVSERNQCFIKITLGPGVLSFELLGVHESECGRETQTSF